MNPIRFLVGLLIAFAVIFGFDFVFHGLYMKEAWYDANAQFWRKPEEVPMQFMLASQALMAFSIGLVLAFAGKHGLVAGVMSGICVGLAMSSLYLVFYAVQPFPQGMVLAWIVGVMAETALAGAIYGLIYRP